MLIEMNLRLLPVIDAPPVPVERLYKDACSADEITINSWGSKWLDYTKSNAAAFSKGNVSELISKALNKPVIICGSGPSLKKNAHHLKPGKIVGANGTEIETYGRGDIPMVSCLHNFSFFEDRDIMTVNDYYLNLDSGDITIREVYEGGKHDQQWYWERTKERTLLAYVGTHPDLISKWQGKVLWFTTPPQSKEIYEETDKVFPYKDTPVFNVGGNALGACLYAARGVMHGSVILFIGADFSFDYCQKFHAWDSPYDKMFSGVVPWVDIWGNRVWTWNSYLNFKKWFDFIAMGGQGHNGHLFVNCTEGGILGAYPEGIIKHIMQLDLVTALQMFSLNNRMPIAMEKNMYLF